MRVHNGLRVIPCPGTEGSCPPGIIQHLLAEVKEQLLEYEDGAGAAEDNQWLPSEETKHGARHCCAKEALHDTLGTDETQVYGGAVPGYIPMDIPDGDKNEGLI